MSLPLSIVLYDALLRKFFTLNIIIMNTNAIREFASSFQKSRILLSGFELDIFTCIEESGSTNNHIAGKLHLDENACERLLNALAS